MGKRGAGESMAGVPGMQGVRSILVGTHPAQSPASSPGSSTYECSKPSATKEEMGSQMPMNLPLKSRAELASQMARHTMKLARTPAAGTAGAAMPARAGIAAGAAHQPG